MQAPPSTKQAISDLFDPLRDLIPSGQLRSIVYALLIMVGGVIVARILRRFFRASWLHPQQQQIIGRILSYFVHVLALTWALHELGVSIGALIGAAGILTVALGFGARTATTNLISGLFLMGERPFVVGDIIKVGDASGTVLSIDLLSIKLRTLDNLLERVPNENVLKLKVTNMTRFPIRRLDLKFGVPHDTDLGLAKKVLLEAAAKVQLCLEEPKPRVFYQGFSESALDLQLSVWSVREKYLEHRDQMVDAMLKALRANNVRLATPRRSVDGALADSPSAVSTDPAAAAQAAPSEPGQLL